MLGLKHDPREVYRAMETISEQLKSQLPGEDIYLKEEFIKLIDARAVDIVHPDLASSGGLLETKKIGDYAEEKGVAMAMHFAGTPVSFMANVHCAAATHNFMALEHHSVDVDYWLNLVKTKTPMVEKGFATVPEAPGLGVELNEEVVKKHLDPENPGYFGLHRSGIKTGHGSVVELKNDQYIRSNPAHPRIRDAFI